MSSLLQVELEALWECFPPGANGATAPSLEDAPRHTRLCASLLEAAARSGHAGDAEALQVLGTSLVHVFGELDRRARGLAEAPVRASPPSAAELRVERALFLCAVLLLVGALSAAPTATAATSAASTTTVSAAFTVTA